MHNGEVTQNIYDSPEFFAGYQKLRENPNNANEREEKPALFSIAPDLAGKMVLDLGCGYGENCAKFKQLGAAKARELISRSACWKSPARNTPARNAFEWNTSTWT